MEPPAVARFDRSLSRRDGAVDLSGRAGSKFVGTRGNLFGPRGRGAYLIFSALGLCGFIGLLVASHFMPPQAMALRIAALAWFLGFGVIRMAFLRGRRRR
jgi:peptidoglycan/LPS O-acetylase OafA/YrhL